MFAGRSLVFEPIPDWRGLRASRTPAPAARLLAEFAPPRALDASRARALQLYSAMRR
jgi:hypothetical protein